MNHHEVSGRAQSGRVQWGSYGFLAGVLFGVLLGWSFHGFIGAFIRVGLVALVVVPLILIYLAWRKFLAPLLRPPVEHEYVAPLGSIETRGIIREPRAR
jgi:hypothetical protein